MSENKQDNTTVNVQEATVETPKVEAQPAAAPKVEVQAEVKAEVKVETKPTEVKVEAPKNRLIDGAVDALNKKLDFRV
jgi:hypothetical protein